MSSITTSVINESQVINLVYTQLGGARTEDVAHGKEAERHPPE